MSTPAIPVNEPVQSYAPRTPEREALVAELGRQAKVVEPIPLVVGGARIMTDQTRSFTSPHDHARVLGHHALAQAAQVRHAVDAALAAHGAWASRDLEARASVFQRAASLLAGPWRQRMNAATMLNQSKTAHQAEIDAACELVDFLRFNVHFARRLAAEQPISLAAEKNRMDLRPLDGFVYAVTPFNFTAIAGNLPTAPALLGNTVVWKPSPHAVLSAHRILELLTEAGLPEGVINLVYGDAELVTREVLSQPDFSGLHFTGSTAVLRGIWSQITRDLARYKSYPRVVGETGGKDFIVAHPTADLDALAVAIVRGGFEYQGQKCSAASRIYVPSSIWPRLEEKLRAAIGEIKVGDPADFRNFMGAVISRQAYERITSYQQLAREDAGCRVVIGGTARDDVGFFVDPTVVEVTDPRHRLMAEEIFGPIVATFVYEDSRFKELLELVDSTSSYALTGALFARDRRAVELALGTLRFAAGNFYLNDKPTGAVVGQQPFGGGRHSGTNDKAGSILNLTRWTSPRVIKENLDPPRDWRYPFMG
jgi:1-pyrroline-5-carboxylate dehydrogenase